MLPSVNAKYLLEWVGRSRTIPLSCICKQVQIRACLEQEPRRQNPRSGLASFYNYHYMLLMWLCSCILLQFRHGGPQRVSGMTPVEVIGRRRWTSCQGNLKHWTTKIMKSYIQGSILYHPTDRSNHRLLEQETVLAKSATWE